MRTITFAALLISVLTFSFLTSLSGPVGATGGARSDLALTFYSTPDDAWNALVNGQIDFMQWELTKQQKSAAELNPNLQVIKRDGSGKFQFDVNNNYTIMSYPGVRSATNELKVRQAIARLVDKDYIVNSILEGFAVRNDVPMSAVLGSWINESVVGDNYPYPYSPEAAAQLLTEAGFADTDGNGWLNYPADWDGAPEADTTVYPLVVCVRSDDAERLAFGQYLISQLETTLAATSIGAGFKTTGDTWIQPRSVLSPKVMQSVDYNVYTGGWGMGSGPPLYLYNLYHTPWWSPVFGWSNYVTGTDKNGNLNYPDLDNELELFMNAPDFADGVFHAKNAESLIIAKYCINVELVSYSYFYAYGKSLAATVNMNYKGLENDYTFLNAYNTAGGPIRVGAAIAPNELNILYSDWVSEYLFLDRVYAGASSVQPYDLAEEQPWIVQDWEIGTWDDGGQMKTVVTYYIRKDVGIAAPVTGTFAGNFDAEDYEFSIWYNYAFDDSWQWASFMDVRYTKLVDVNGDGWKEIQVYFDYQSFWAHYAPTYPLLPKTELLDLLCAPYTESFSSTGTNENTLTNEVVSVTSASLDGSPLTEGVDYIIRGGYDVYSHKVFVPLRDLTGTVSITYWYPDIPAAGFYLAGKPWTETMYTMGTHYPVSMTHDPPMTGDTITLAKNPYFFLDTPPLGEVDWRWNFVGSTKPRSGYFKIDILDVVKATGAYSSRGDGLYDPRYLAGADVDSSDLCHIGILDLVSITGKYGQTFGTPPS